MHLLYLQIVAAVLIGQCFCAMTPDVKRIVAKALDQAKEHLVNRQERPANGTYLHYKMKREPETIRRMVIGNLLHEATKIVVKEHGMEFLEKIDNNEVQTMLAAVYPDRVKRQVNEQCIKDDADCRSKNNYIYRTITGQCNNINVPQQGAGLTTFRRLLGSASYGDGLGTMRQSVTGGPLPSPRVISNAVNAGTPESPTTNLSHFMAPFGQFLAHDIVLTPTNNGKDGLELACDECSDDKELCAPFEVPPNDPYFPSTQKCIRMTRAVNAQSGFGTRIQMNQNTHYIDLSSVYGSSECDATEVRSFVDGQLRVQETSAGILPPAFPTDPQCHSKAPHYCFKCGDFRAVVEPGLAPIHTLWILEHNRVAKEIKNLKPSLDDETIYQVTRRYVNAEFQHIVYNEFLPLVFGPERMEKFNLRPLTSGRTTYDPNQQATLFVEVTNAHRFGHTIVQKEFARSDMFNTTIAPPVDIGNNIFSAEAQYKDGGAATLTGGLIYYPQMKADNSFVFPMRNQILETRGKKGSGIDLIATNIQRGRDVGLHPYVDYREAAGLGKATSFDDLYPTTSRAQVEVLRNAYKDVRDIDLFYGIFSEDAVPGGILGPTASFILAEQYRSLKFGDRFYYEHAPGNSRGLTDGELAEIRKTTMAGVICRSYPHDFLLAPEHIFQFKSSTKPCTSIVSAKVSGFLKDI